MLYFVVRTDVTADDGLQRVFGAFDTPQLAEKEKANVESHSRGEFAVYEGAPVGAGS